MTAQPTVTTEDISTQLTVLEQRVSALADPDGLADTICDALNDLAREGEVTEEHLDTIFVGTTALAETASALAQTMHASLGLARTIQQQRDAVQHKLTALQDAVRTCDYTVPEVEALRETIEEVVMEWQAMTWQDDVWEYVMEMISCNTPLDGDEASHLLDLLSGDGPDDRSDLWTDLRRWIERAEADTREARAQVR